MEKEEKSPLVPVTNHSANKDDDGAPKSVGTIFLCDPRHWVHRFLMLFLMCMLSFGT